MLQSRISPRPISYLRSSILDSRSLLLVAVPPRYFRAGITKRAKRSMDLRTLS